MEVQLYYLVLTVILSDLDGFAYGCVAILNRLSKYRKRKNACHHKRP